MIRIAIDGPGGAGKSSLAKAVAKKLGIIYVDTGALYRSVGLYMLKNGISPEDTAAVISALPSVSLEMKFAEGKQIILLCGEDVGESIRTPEVSMAASTVSAIKEVREFLLATQRNIASTNSVIMDGRDIGTVILPDAEVKIFLTASPEARAKRRYEELKAKGVETTYEEVFKQMEERDRTDSTREISPCIPADDAIFLDNSKLTANGTVKAVLKIIKKTVKRRTGKGPILYLLFKYCIRPFYTLALPLKVTGKENIPKDGPVIICSNHIGVHDVFMVSFAYHRQIHFLAKTEWFKNPIMGIIVRMFGAIELDRGGKDVGALKNAINALKSGLSLSIFPQGHRYPDVNPAETPIKSGLGLIAYHSKTPILPMCIKTGKVRYRFLKKTEVIIGKPLSFEELGFKNGGSAEYKAATEKAFEAVCKLGGYEKSSSDGEKTEEKN